MSNAIYPSGLPGEAYPVVRTPSMSTIVQKTQSGREVRIANYSYPLWMWEIPYSWLTFGDPHKNGDTFAFTLQTIAGFFNSRYGSWDSFLLRDQDDYGTINPATIDSPSPTRVPSLIGVGDGTTNAFQAGRTMGGFFEQIFDVDTASYTPVIYSNGLITTGSISASGVVSFTGGAPPAGHAIALDCNYFWRVRFLEDSIDFSRFMRLDYEVKSVKLYQTRT